MKLTPHNFREAEYRRNTWLVTVDSGTTLEHLTSRDYWANVAARMKPRDRVEVHAQDGSWMAEMLVVQASRVGASLALLHKHDLAAQASAPRANEDDVKIEFRGFAKWRAVRLSDKSVLIDGLETEQEVRDWLKRPAALTPAA